MAVRVTVDDAAAQAMLQRIQRVMATDAKTMGKVALAMKQEVYNAFRFEQDPDGRAWPALKPATLRARARAGNHSQQKLIATSAMYNSIEHSAAAGEAVVEMGSGLPDARAIFNQFGTRHAPPRASMPLADSGAPDLTPDWVEAITKPLNKALEEAAQT